MSDIKPKLTLRAGVNGAEKTPSPSTKLMLNHGKPNFTINRTKVKNDSQCPFSPTNPEAATVVLKSTANSTSNGYVKPTLMKIPLSSENEVSKVVLRRTKLPEENEKPVQQDEEPEFVKAQRKIAERLANQNSLDFETRKSGYFTHVMISPTSPTKQMELPVVADHKIEKASVVEVVSERTVEPVVEPQKPVEEPVKTVKEPQKPVETPNESATTKIIDEKSETEKKDQPNTETPKENGHDSSQINGSVEEEKPTEVVEAAKAMIEELVENVAKEIPSEKKEEVPTPIQNGHDNGVEKPIENGVHNGSDKDVVTNGDSISENQSQENGVVSSQSDVNFEPKTVTSFAKDLSSEPNKYPDTVKIVTEVPPSATEQDDLMKDMYKLKFDIHADSEDVKVIPTVRPTE
ncbi:WASH complex subunit 2 [Eupeodes corollae]|uniref:WASH complex subunit 2 n=1 Tax=Eupeodes corollae TaxID=290404 RepID=UPI0024901234|nr:WASH complex subunit 2 [Eupeodes corollae]XP_055923781.1 WASH complex subunit 2 [Eupeodes corollae]